MKINPDKRYTVDGLTARLVSDKGPRLFPYMFVCTHEGGHEWVAVFNEDGCSPSDWNPPTLREVKEKKSGWTNIYPSELFHAQAGTIYVSKEQADEFKGSGRVACIQVEWDE